VRFDARGSVVDAYAILAGTSRNCSGGPTPWGTWLSCEENGEVGRVWECDPLRAGEGSRRDALGSFAHEAAVVDPSSGRVYLTEDDPKGRLYRFTPDARGDLSAGRLEAARVDDGLVTWVPTSPDEPDRQRDTTRFKGGEGAWIHAGILFFTTKGDNRVWELKLSTGAIAVLYEAAAGGSLSGVDNITAHAASGDLFVCEDGDNMELCIIPAATGERREVAPFLRVSGQSSSELTGVAFSPAGRRMYVSSQRGTGSSGITYEVRGPFRTSSGSSPHTLVARGTTWRYRDDGSDQGTSWRKRSFDDRGWRSGAAPLGYGDRVATRISSGPDADRKYITTYFRRTFQARRDDAELHLRVRRDDGVVVYVNGDEVARSNMPSGEIRFDTLAASVFTGSPEANYYAIPIRAALVTGTNVIAAEVHQGDRLSSDLIFDLELTT
jgi:secreted PhoX family phosphatase